MDFAGPITRRTLFKYTALGSLATAAGSLSPGCSSATSSFLDVDDMNVTDGEEALKLLVEGNHRYVHSDKIVMHRASSERRLAIAESQKPFAIILACADSRVAPELVFDQGLGDLFVVRVAGNIVNDSNYGLMGSIEYGALVLGTPLLMVLGHENCGAVDAAVKAVKEGATYPGAISDIVNSITPAVEAVTNEPGNLLHNATVANVNMGVERLKQSKSVLTGLVAAGKLKVVGANYNLATGKVDILSA